jgi:hypothetical protein
MGSKNEAHGIDRGRYMQPRMRLSRASCTRKCVTVGHHAALLQRNIRQSLIRRITGPPCRHADGIRSTKPWEKTWNPPCRCHFILEGLQWESLVAY